MDRRLIDAEVLKRELDLYWHGAPVVFADKVLSAIDAQPTAFDKDAVLEEFDKQKKWYEEHGCNEDLRRGIIGATNMAISIVEKGGV